MTCRDCLEKFSALSADNVSQTSALSLHEHLQACPQCKDEWVLFERTLVVLSTSTQILPAPEASEQMWKSCAEHVFESVEKQRNGKRRTPRRAGVLGWFGQQPRWSWASLAGAVAILAAAWFFAPHDETLNAIAGAGDALRNAPTSQAGLGPGALVTFQRPPAAASGLVNHHSAMAADPFADNVGSTMASYSATSPAKAPSPTSAIPKSAPVLTPPVSAFPAPPNAAETTSTPAAITPDISTPTPSAPVVPVAPPVASSLPSDVASAPSTSAAPTASSAAPGR